ncbi:MAG: hypothetical protein CMO77_02170 [Verrucomicrobiales bacterium]|nr:hypothetical protein [Verrucomicrobiales bacterium]
MKIIKTVFLIALTTPVLGETVDFHQDIAPILREYCVGCHNNDDLEGELSVETFKLLMKGGENGVPIKAGDQLESLLAKVITKQAKPYMPPRREPQLSAAQIDTILRWIDQGAKAPTDDRSILANLAVPEIKPASNILSPVTAMAISKNGQLVIGRYGMVQSGDKTLTGIFGKVNAIAISSDNKTLAVAGGTPGLKGVATLFNLETGKKLHDLIGHRDALYGIAFSPDGNQLATAGYDRIIQLWNSTSGEQLRTLKGHNGAVYGIAFSPDGSVLTSAGGDSSVKLWNTENGQRLDTFGQPTGEQFLAMFTPDSRFILAGGADKQVRLWHWISGNQTGINPLAQVRFVHEDEITDLTIDPSGELLATASADRTVKVWSLPGLEPLQTIGNQEDVVSALVFSTNGQTLHVGRMDGSVEKIDLRLDKLSYSSAKNIAKTKSVELTKKEPVELTEKEPNNLPTEATPITLPAIVTGIIHGKKGIDSDLFRFKAMAGEEWVLETNAAQSKSPIDTKIEVLDTNGIPIERARLKAIRESWLTFRGKDSSTSNDFRLFKWDEMKLNQLLYINGEVVKLWLYPRGPDSGYIVYPGSGNRHGYFDTTPLAHPLGQPAYIVEPLASGEPLIANGLPTFPIYYQNDDESQRRLGRDSKLTFTTPADGEYLAKVSDIRGFQGSDFKYMFTIRERQPDFKISINGFSDGIPRGSGREFSFRVERKDNFNGPIQLDISKPHTGFHISTPIIIEAEQQQAFGSIHANADAATPENDFLTVTATATLRGKKIIREVGKLTNIKPLDKPKLLVQVTSNISGAVETGTFTEPLEFKIAPGETISARVKVERNGFNGRIQLGSHDAGRNLPHGVYVDNIGLSGLLIVEGQTEREFFITADSWVPESRTHFHIKASAEKGIVSNPLIIQVRKN